MRIDLHTHSTASDGTDRPADLVRAALGAGLDVVALTDHDTLSGLSEAQSVAAGAIQLIPGVEISCVNQGISLHLLGYWPDPQHPALSAELELNRDDRVPRAQEMVRQLAEAGYPITWADVERQISPGATVGRPHLADALVARGVVPDRDAAFADLLHNDSSFYVSHHATEPAEAIRLVTAAGGVVVFAHPGAGRRGRLVSDQVIADLATVGLAGLEVDHPDHDVQARLHYGALAKELGLVGTGSSDFHGTGKLQQLGACTTDPDALARLASMAPGSAIDGPRE